MSMRSAGNHIALPKNMALLGACCFFLSAIEYLIPKPLPFLRIGLANLPLMLALNIFPLRAYIVLVCIKVTGQALITGTLFSYIFLFSIAGTFSSAMLMFTLKRIFKQRISFVGIGTAGAMVSNTAQLALAWFFIFKESVRYIAPPFLAVGLAAGAALGVFCEVFVKRSKWYNDQIANSNEQLVNNREKSLLPTPHCQLAAATQTNLTPILIGCFLITLAILFSPSTVYRVAAFLFLWVIALIFNKAGNPVFTIIVIAVIIAFNLLVPYGYVLFSIGPFKITSGALVAGIHRAVTFQALVMLSKLTIREDLRLPGAFGKLLSESLQIFNKMTTQKIKFTGKNIIENIDTLLMGL